MAEIPDRLSSNPLSEAITDSDAIIVHNDSNSTTEIGTFAAVKTYMISALASTFAALSHTHTKAEAGLGNVDNTSDANKPVSSATQTALDGKAPSSHSHATSEVTGLDAALAAKADDSQVLTDVPSGAVFTDTNTQLTQEQVEDYVAAMFQVGTHTNVTVDYDDAAGSISLTGSAGDGGGSTLTQEQVEDFVAGVSTAGSGINVTYDDAGNTLTFALTGESYTTTEKNKLAAFTATFTTEIAAEVTANTAKTGVTTSSVLAAGALMDSELADIAAVKALNQGVATTDDVTFADVEVTGEIGFDGIVDNGNSGTSDTVTWTAGNMQKSTLTGNCTFTFVAPTLSGRYSLTLIQDGTGSRLVTWPASVRWPGGTAPTLSTAASAVDKVTFEYDGTNFDAVSSLNFS